MSSAKRNPSAGNLRVSRKNLTGFPNCYLNSAGGTGTVLRVVALSLGPLVFEHARVFARSVNVELEPEVRDVRKRGLTLADLE